MDQPALIIEVQRGGRGLNEHYAFGRSPVHIGRGPRNELLIDHVFVSHYHGVLHFDVSGIDYLDLGSTNGSYVEGTRIESHRYMALHTGTTLGIGPLRLCVKLDVRAGRREPRPAIAEPCRLDLAAPPSVSRASFGVAHPFFDRASGSALPPLAGAEQADALAAVAQRLARSFLALSRGQRQWRQQLGLPLPARSGLRTPETPSALIRYLAESSSRLDELDVACEELLRDELALVQAILRSRAESRASTGDSLE